MVAPSQPSPHWPTTWRARTSSACRSSSRCFAGTFRWQAWASSLSFTQPQASTSLASEPCLGYKAWRRSSSPWACGPWESWPGESPRSRTWCCARGTIRHLTPWPGGCAAYLSAPPAWPSSQLACCQAPGAVSLRRLRACAWLRGAGAWRRGRSFAQWDSLCGPRTTAIGWSRARMVGALSQWHAGTPCGRCSGVPSWVAPDCGEASPPSPRQNGGVRLS
mmetsp:Transcript_107704/g.303404  ORF Transcript_107704/g.303404 Transcript_107704/m.303404 type:complete len:220 (-) Transcript_107704:394-1053(-)